MCRESSMCVGRVPCVQMLAIDVGTLAVAVESTSDQNIRMYM